MMSHKPNPVYVQFSPEDYATLQEIAAAERAPLAAVVRRFVGQNLDKHRQKA